MRKTAFWKALKKDILNIFLSFAILVLITFSLLFLIKITLNIVLTIIWHILLLSDIIAICMLLGIFGYVIIDYKYQKKHYEVIKKHLNNNYHIISPNRDNLSSLSILNQPDIVCKAKLNPDGNVILRMENINTFDSFHETTISNFDLFCMIFNFGE